MASTHHFIGWHAWFLPSSPWQCECPPASIHHGNGSVPQQPSAWAKCKPLNQDHHGNMCLPKHWAVACLWVCVLRKYKGKELTVGAALYHQAMVVEFFFSFFFYTFSTSLLIVFFMHVLFSSFHCIIWAVLWSLPCPKWGLAEEWHWQCCGPSYPAAEYTRPLWKIGVHIYLA